MSGARKGDGATVYFWDEAQPATVRGATRSKIVVGIDKVKPDGTFEEDPQAPDWAFFKTETGVWRKGIFALEVGRREYKKKDASVKKAS